jgi:hypothetical protein
VSDFLAASVIFRVFFFNRDFLYPLLRNVPKNVKQIQIRGVRTQKQSGKAKKRLPRNPRAGEAGPAAETGILREAADNA